MRYFRPSSLTWWSGCLAITTGMAALALPDHGSLTEFSRLIGLFSGTADGSPAGLIFLGFGLIGLRDRIERGFKGGPATRH